MNDMELRGQALQAALATSHPQESGDEILSRARDYYQFIAGKSPDHNPAPASLKAA